MEHLCGKCKKVTQNVLGSEELCAGNFSEAKSGECLGVKTLVVDDETAYQLQVYCDFQNELLETIRENISARMRFI